jgi:hypothetical protein
MPRFIGLAAGLFVLLIARWLFPALLRPEIRNLLIAAGVALVLLFALISKRKSN